MPPPARFAIDSRRDRAPRQRMLRRMADAPETLDLLRAIEHRLEGMRRLTTPAERLANRAALSEAERGTSTASWNLVAPCSPNSMRW